jgi:4-hydroxybenzoate polyprenyltransferase
LKTLIALIRSLRPHQWVKNSFVLAPLVFSLNVDEPAMLLRAGLATLAFCLISGAVYLLNDVVDAEADRRHPVKCRRPIAAGLISESFARWACAALVVSALALALSLELWVAGVTALYFLSNLAYSFKLKHVAYLDVSIIAFGFILRILAGSFAIDVPLSIYLVSCTFLLSLYLAFGKRLHELAATGTKRQQRTVLERYRLSHLRVATLSVAVLTILAYTAYTLAPHTQSFFGFEAPRLLATVPFAALGVARFYKLASSTRPASPTDQMLRDPLFLANFLAWVLTTLAVVYFL